MSETRPRTVCPVVPRWKFWVEQHVWKDDGPQQGTIYTALWIPLVCVRCGVKGHRTL